MENIDIAALVKSLSDWHTWLLISVVAAAGVIGGLAHKLSSPSEDRTSTPKYVVVGIVASLAVLFVFIPKDPVRLIALSLTAGYGGKAVLDALEAKVRTAIAEADADRAKKQGLKAVEAGKRAVNYANELMNINSVFLKTQPQPILDISKASLSAEAAPLATAPPADELKRLDLELGILAESFRE